MTKLRIKSMFNSDDCGPLTENSGSLSSIKGLRKKGGIEGRCWLGKRKKRVETTDRNNGIVIRCISGDEEKPSGECEPEDENLFSAGLFPKNHLCHVTRLLMLSTETDS